MWIIRAFRDLLNWHFPEIIRIAIVMYISARHIET